MRVRTVFIQTDVRPHVLGIEAEAAVVVDCAT